MGQSLVESDIIRFMVGFCAFLPPKRDFSRTIDIYAILFGLRWIFEGRVVVGSQYVLWSILVILSSDTFCVNDIL